jgi:hypothetical protein
MHFHSSWSFLFQTTVGGRTDRQTGRDGGDGAEDIQTLIASVQLVLFSMLPASITRDTGVPSDLMERTVKVYSMFLEKRNEEDGDLVNFCDGGISSTSSETAAFVQLQSIVVLGVIRHSPFRVV